MTTPYVIHIQKYSIHDGEGIRTTVFFKGCPLSCIWCHNPESQNYNPELMYQREKCICCHACIKVCPQKAIQYQKSEKQIKWDKNKCNLCGECSEYCPIEAINLAGKHYSIKELVKEIEKDKMFYENSFGGVTLSGGEVMAQDMDYIEELVKNLYHKGYRVNIDTCGYTSYSNFSRILPYIDTFLYDVKIIERKKHKKFTGRGNKIILENLKSLSKDGAKINIRIPVIEGINEDDKSVLEMITFLKKDIKFIKINLLPYHNTGSGKYRQLGIEYKGNMLCPPDEERMSEIEGLFKKNGIVNVCIGG